MLSTLSRRAAFTISRAAVPARALMTRQHVAAHTAARRVHSFAAVAGCGVAAAFFSPFPSSSALAEAAAVPTPGTIAVAASAEGTGRTPQKTPKLVIATWGSRMYAFL